MDKDKKLNESFSGFLNGYASGNVSAASVTENPIEESASRLIDRFDQIDATGITSLEVAQFLVGGRRLSKQLVKHFHGDGINASTMENAFNILKRLFDEFDAADGELSDGDSLEVIKTGLSEVLASIVEASQNLGNRSLLEKVVSFAEKRADQ